MNRRKFISRTVTAGAAVPFVPLAPRRTSGGPGFHLGAITYNTLKNFDVETIFACSKKPASKRVELRTGHKHGVEPSIGQEERARVKRLFEQSKIRLVSYGTTCRFQSPMPPNASSSSISQENSWIWRMTPGALGIKIQPMGFPEGVPRETTIQTFGGALHESAITAPARESKSGWRSTAGAPPILRWRPPS